MKRSLVQRLEVECSGLKVSLYDVFASAHDFKDKDPEPHARFSRTQITMGNI